MLIELWLVYFLTSFWAALRLFPEDFVGNEFDLKDCVCLLLALLFCAAIPFQIIWVGKQVPIVLTFLFKERKFK